MLFLNFQTIGSTSIDLPTEHMNVIQISGKTSHPFKCKLEAKTKIACV